MKKIMAYKMRFCFSIFMLFIAHYASAQLTISGRVIDEKTKKGISGASVYLNNSTFGAQTDGEGNFSFNGTILGKTSLIISHIAYERKIHVIEDKNLTNLVFSLHQQVKSLNEIVIKSRHSKADLTKWINLFTYNLIGVYNNSHHQCRIKNNGALYFDFDSYSHTLKVFAKEPLIIENNFLNYKITIDLEQFEYNFDTNEVIFKYFAFYEDLPQKVLTAKQIQKNRILAYEGSSMHFMRSVYKNNLEAQWFYLYKYSAQFNKEKIRVESIIRKKIAETYLKEKNPDVSLAHLFSGDTLKYYKEVMNQESVLKHTGDGVAVQKFLTRDKETRTVNFNFPDTLTITYDKNKLSREKKISALIAKGKGLSDIPQPIYLYTYMTLFKTGGINIQANGYYPEQSLFMWGDMPERRIGVSLPYDFNVISP